MLPAASWSGSNQTVPVVSLIASFLRYYRAPRVFTAGSWQGWILLPTVDLTMRLLTDVQGALAYSASAGTELTGLRVAGCLGSVSLLAEIRGPLVGAGMIATPGVDDDGEAAGEGLGKGVHPMVLVGASVAVGISW